MNAINTRREIEIMLAMILCLVLSVIFTIIFVRSLDMIADWPAYVSGSVGMMGWMVFLVMVILVIGVNVGIKGKIAAKQQTYDSLVYQLENGLYDNANGVGKQELYEKITEWNADVARGKTMQHDLWIGVFYPDIYDDFDLIEVDGIHADQPRR